MRIDIPKQSTYSDAARILAHALKEKYNQESLRIARDVVVLLRNPQFISDGYTIHEWIEAKRQIFEEGSRCD